MGSSLFFFIQWGREKLIKARHVEKRGEEKVSYVKKFNNCRYKFRALFTRGIEKEKFNFSASRRDVKLKKKVAKKKIFPQTHPRFTIKTIKFNRSSQPSRRGTKNTFWFIWHERCKILYPLPYQCLTWLNAKMIVKLLLLLSLTHRWTLLIPHSPLIPPQNALWILSFRWKFSHYEHHLPPSSCACGKVIKN